MLKCLSLQHNKNFSINFTNTALRLSSSSKANFSSESTLTDFTSIICTQFSTHNSLASVLDTPPKYPGSSTSSSPGFPPTLWAVLASFGKFTNHYMLNFLKVWFLNLLFMLCIQSWWVHSCLLRTYRYPTNLCPNPDLSSVPEQLLEQNSKHLICTS